MKFCPVCFHLLYVSVERQGNLLSCLKCSYRYQLINRLATTVKYHAEDMTEDFSSVVIVGSEEATLSVTTALCPKCGHGRAYFEQRQNRSADEAATLFFTCVQCKEKWNE